MLFTDDSEYHGQPRPISIPQKKANCLAQDKSPVSHVPGPRKYFRESCGLNMSAVVISSLRTSSREMAVDTEETQNSSKQKIRSCQELRTKGDL